jgi:SAM-dependent methyltransferase
VRGRLAHEPLRQVAQWFDERANTYDDDEFHAWLAAEVAARAGPCPGKGRVLDVGAGTGRASRQSGGQPAVLLDVSPAMLRAARRHDPNAAAICGEAHRLPFAEGSFDRVICVAVDSFLDLVVFAAEAARVLRPCGDLVMTAWADPPGSHRVGRGSRPHPPTGRARRPRLRCGDVAAHWSTLRRGHGAARARALMASMTSVSGQGDVPLRWCGAEGTRTPDPLVANEVRYQLRYSPWWRGRGYQGSAVSRSPRDGG